MTVSCKLCGEEWNRDPALEVECPSCLAPIGVRCRRPSQHSCPIHVTRDRLALSTVAFYTPCLAVTRQEPLFQIAEKVYNREL